MINAKAAVTIVTGPNAAAREDAIIAALAACDTSAMAGNTVAVLLEGVPDGSERFSKLQQQADFTLLPVVRSAAGCMCCTGNLAMRVHLNRLLRAKPQLLYIGASTATHLAALQDFLSLPPYDELLVLNRILDAV